MIQYLIGFLIVLILYGEYSRHKSNKNLQNTVESNRVVLKEGLDKSLQELQLMMGIPIDLQNKKGGGV